MDWKAFLPIFATLLGPFLLDAWRGHGRRQREREARKQYYEDIADDFRRMADEIHRMMTRLRTCKAHIDKGGDGWRPYFDELVAEAMDQAKWDAYMVRLNTPLGAENEDK